MELRQLKYFVAVAGTLNFSDAARRLFITQGTLSQQIKQLEDEVGARLLDRTSHGVTLTEAGEELLPLAKRTLEASDICRNRMNDLRGALVGTLNIGVTHSFSGLLTDTVKTFLKQNPGVKLNIRHNTAAELLESLRQKTLDFIVAFRPVSEYDDIESEVLFRSYLSVVMRRDHPLAGRKSINFDDIQRQGLVLPASGLQARKNFDRFVGVNTASLNVRIELNDPNMIMDIVQGTNLITVVSSLASAYRPNLVAVPLEDGGHEMLGCVQRLKEGYRKRSAEVFLDMLRESARLEQICRDM